MTRLTEGVKILLIVMCGIFALEWILNAEWALRFGLIPAMASRGHVYQLVSYIFLHGSILHLLFNGLGLFFFGPALEERWGTGKFLAFFLGTGVAGGVLAMLLEPNSLVPVIGASGAVYGILAASAVLFPNAVIYLYMIIPVRAKWLIIGLGAYEFFMLFRGGVGVSHEAHLGGMISGGLYVFASEKLLGYRIRRWWRQRRYNREYAAREREREHTDSLRHEVDELLDKINRKGIDSLSERERRRLDEASRKLRGE